jgi:O-antigen/teichoic acid export membrane protein
LSYAGTVIQGVTWTGGGRLASQALQFGVSLLLMRLLLPEDFGLLAMVVVFTGFATAMSDMGLSAALVQRENLGLAHRDTAFWVTLGLGASLTLLFVLGAPAVGAFYGSGELVRITRALAPIFVLTTIGNVPLALLQREYRFRRMAAADFAGTLFGALVGVILALEGYGVWALVLMQLSSALVTSCVALVLAAWWPGFHLQRAAFSDLFAFGGGLTGSRLLNYWARQLDNLLIGRFMSAATLGLYSRAYALMLLPLSHLMPAISRVLFPVLSSIQADRHRVKGAYIRLVRLLGLIVFPVMLGLAATADNFVLVVFGQQWTEVVPLVQILAPVGVVQILISPGGLIYTSQGRTDRMFQWGVVASTTLMVAIVIGVWLGSAEAVAWSYLVANVLLLYPAVKVPGDLIGMSPGSLFVGAMGPLAIAVGMALTVWAAGAYWMAGWSSTAALLSQVLLGIVLYVAPVLGLRLDVVNDLRDLIRRRGEAAAA